MYSFAILCFVAVTAAAPQGYNYPIQQSWPAAADSANNEQGIYNFRPQPSITKHFFLHSAPEEVETEIQHRDITIGQPRKNLNVVFIKSPVAAAQKTKLHIIPAGSEEKTVIYVLAKKAGEDEIIAQVEDPHTTTARPEVFFIKYKTNEEAEHAQSRIQAEYDRLGGSSIISNEGIAPVTSVIGSLDSHEAGVSETGVNAVPAAEASGSAYLPPVK